MIAVWNRKELIITMDIAQQAAVRDILSQNGIEYKVKTINLQSATFAGAERSRLGGLGINQKYSYEYKIYVHKKDYEKAKYLINVL